MTKSISILLGAGFSVPQGYPKAKDIKDRLCAYSSCPDFIDNEDAFEECKKLIANYSWEGDSPENPNNYEDFYDYLCQQPQDKVSREAIEVFLHLVEDILEDKDGKRWYPHVSKMDESTDEYKSFLDFLSYLIKYDYKVNIHTLNHDLFLDSLNNRQEIQGMMTDGFDEYGSCYYGKICLEGDEYLCRLQRYRGKYNKPIRIIKLHGSLDYVIFNRMNKSMIASPDNFVKTKEKIDLSSICKSRRSKLSYEHDASHYHTDFLTGRIAKKSSYHEPHTYAKLFRRFRNNLTNAESLIIIGYSFGDDKINDIILEKYDYKDKPIYIFDLKANDQMNSFMGKTGAIFKELSFEKIQLANYKECIGEKHTGTDPNEKHSGTDPNVHQEYETTIETK